MSIPKEALIFVVGAVALIIAAVSTSALDKLKKSCTAGLDQKQYKLAKDLQIAQIVVSALVVLLSGWVLVSQAKTHAGYQALPGAARISRYARSLVQ